MSWLETSLVLKEDIDMNEVLIRNIRIEEENK